MLHCDYCGRSNKEGALTCSGCGTLLVPPQKALLKSPRSLRQVFLRAQVGGVAFALFLSLLPRVLSAVGVDNWYTLGIWVLSVMPWCALRRLLGGTPIMTTPFDINGSLICNVVLGIAAGTLYGLVVAGCRWLAARLRGSLSTIAS